MNKIQGKSTLVRDSEGLTYLESTVFWGNLHVHSYPIPPILFSSFHLFIVLITNNCLGNCKEKLPLKHCQLTIGYRLTVNSIFHSHIFFILVFIDVVTACRVLCGGRHFSEDEETGICRIWNRTSAGNIFISYILLAWW